MIFQQFYLESLGHASYLVGSEETGEAFVLDPRRDVDIYFQAARAHGLRIRYAADSHQHNDYLSGCLELAHRTEILLLTGSESGVTYDARRMADRERLEMGEVVFEVLHTPGHTPEHISLLVMDGSRGKAPALFLSGGALLVGDVARPDLLGGREETEKHAAQLCQTLQEKVLKLDDFVEVYPTRVAGSLCGGHISSRLSTTIGYERRMNKMLAGITSKTEFVKHCVELDQLPAVPPYWKRMRKLNTEGPPLLGVMKEPSALQPKDMDAKIKEGTLILDCRSPEAFAGGHIPGALNAGLGASFPTWAGTILPPDKPYLLVLEKPEDLSEVCRHLLRIGYDIPAGWLSGGMQAWRTAALPLHIMREWTVWDLEREMKKQSNSVILDVRQPHEWHGGHIEGAMHITGAELPQRIHEVPKNRSIAVICGSGYRSSVAASVLLHNGHHDVTNILGGMSAWNTAGLPTTKN